MGCSNECTHNEVIKIGELPVFNWGSNAPKPNFDWVKEVGAHSVPNGKIYKATAFGLLNDTTLLSTEALQSAIDACNQAGGGRVTVPQGDYRIGAIFLKSNVELHLEKGATLIADEELSLYPEMRSRIAGIEMVWPSAVINVLNAENVMISGEGTIDCRGKVHWDKYWDLRKEYTPRGLRWIVDYDCKRVRGMLVSDSKHVTLKGFTLLRTGFWACQVLYSENCTLSGLTINNNLGGHGPSTDGIDIDSSSKILIENCTVDCNDDNICLKAGRDADGLRVNRPTEYVVVRNCIARQGAGLITCGSETSGSIRNVLAYSLQAYGTQTTLRLKSALNRGGIVEDIYMTDVVAENVNYVLSADLNWHPSYSYSTLPEEFEGKEVPEHWNVMLTPVTPEEKGHPLFQNIYLSQVKATQVKQFISASGWSDKLRLKNFYINQVEATAEKAGRIRFTENFAIEGVQLTSQDGSKVELEENNGAVIDITYN
ncbi:MAG: glycoside hydrolase family 28 protein [Phocaeicola sp.]